MNIQYLQNTILPQREKEIQEGKNHHTANPIYFVYDLREMFVSGHNEYSISTNRKGKLSEYGYFDTSLESDGLEFIPDSDGLIRHISMEEVTRFYTDRYVALFLTRKEAEKYLQYQSHNLSDPYIYVHNAGYRNQEWDMLMKEAQTK